jgi:DNA mismatch endonuclease, patch repair protein
MADVFTRQKRSEIMSRVKGRGNLATELRLIGLFRAHGFNGWRRNAALFGRPDFVFPKSRIAVFVDGCFWHGCPIHGSMPQSNRAFWRKKLADNKKRDLHVNRKLAESGWRTVRIWQHELKKPEKLILRLRRKLPRMSHKSKPFNVTCPGR